MSERDTGGSAFPFQAKAADGSPWSPEQGMTLRDWFAGQALAGLLAGADYTVKAEELALQSYLAADYLLKERNK